MELLNSNEYNIIGEALQEYVVDVLDAHHWTEFNVIKRKDKYVLLGVQMGKWVKGDYKLIYHTVIYSFWDNLVYPASPVMIKACDF